MPTAKTTMLPVTASQKLLATDAIRRRLSAFEKRRLAREWMLVMLWTALHPSRRMFCG